MENYSIVDKVFKVYIDKSKIFNGHNILRFSLDVQGEDIIKILSCSKYRDMGNYCYELKYDFNGREFQTEINQNLYYTLCFLSATTYKDYESIKNEIYLTQKEKIIVQ